MSQAPWILGWGMCAIIPTHSKHFWKVTPTISSLRIYPSHHFFSVLLGYILTDGVPLYWQVKLKLQDSSHPPASASWIAEIMQAGIHDCSWPLLRVLKSETPPSVMVHSCDSSTWEVEAEQLGRIQDQPWIYIKFKDSLEYMGICLKTTCGKYDKIHLQLVLKVFDWWRL